MRRLKRVFLFTFLAAAALTIVTILVCIVVFQTGWFKNKVRERIVAEVEKTTGGRVEIGGFNYDWERFTADVAPFVLHGTEPASAPPLFRAANVRVKIRIISFLERTADIASVIIDRPEIHVTRDANGSTNLPTPIAVAQRQSRLVAEVLNLKIQRLIISNGFADYNSRQIPLDFRADNLAATMSFLPGPARYAAEIRANKLHMSTETVHDAAFDVRAKIAIERDRVQIESARLTVNRSLVDISGSVVDPNTPRASFDVKSRFLVADIAQWVALPIERRGEVVFNGKADVEFEPLRYRVQGRLTGRDLAYAGKTMHFPNFVVSSNLNAIHGSIKLSNVDLAALSGHFRGSVDIENVRNFRLNGTAEGFSIQQLAALRGPPAGELSGKVTGPVEVEGVIRNDRLEDVKVQATLQIAPGENGVPVEGSVALRFEQNTGVVQLGNTNLKLGAAEVAASGEIGHSLAVHVTSRNLHDLMLALPLIGEQAPKEFPVRFLNGGLARFDGTVSGPLNSPRITGQLQATDFTVGQRSFTRLAAAIDATRSSLNVRTLALEGEGLSGTASGQLALVDWKPAPQSAVQARLAFRGADIARLIRDSGYKWRTTGALSGSGAIGGTFGAPDAAGHVQADNVSAYDESFNRVSADVTYAEGSLRVEKGRAITGNAEADFSGVYHHSGSDWTSGQLHFAASGRGFVLARIKRIERKRRGVDGRLDFEASGAAHFMKGDFELDDLDSKAAVRGATVDGKPLGDVTATGKTRGQVLDLSADANLRGARIHGQGEWRLTGDYPGQGTIDVPRMTLATLKELLPWDTGRNLPFGGFFSATLNVAGPLKRIDALTAAVVVPDLQINASSDLQPRAGAQPKDLVLRSARPLRFDFSTHGANIRSAEFVGTDTTLQAAGSVGFGDKGLWNLHLNGSINLAILQLFNHDLLASGVSTMNTTIRGSLRQPDINGRLELRNASLYVADVPNGVDKANGVIVFDRSRANIERLSGESGGGTVVFQSGSFVGFSGQTLIYRLQATADHVRYRSPEGVSVTANGSLSLAGTSERSTLSGTLTVTRAAFSPQTDIGSLLAYSARPVSVPAVPNAYVRGLQFDVRIESAQNLEVTTSLTRDIQAEANLRLRGNVERPILLGSISITEGQIEFFGNRYRINRGELTFNNPAKIEPVVDMDLETRVRGITVAITFAGPLEKLNFSYRSDPPLESAQIIALLAVGRQPVGAGAVPGSQATTTTTFLATGTNTILQQAVTAPVSGRLQRFFGVSHIKIDPQLTDITSVPQARLSFEQQISKDITLTYITNLSRTSEQVIRVEWNVSRRWSVVAVRDENGLFGMDLQYRKTFK